MMGSSPRPIAGGCYPRCPADASPAHQLDRRRHDHRHIEQRVRVVVRGQGHAAVRLRPHAPQEHVAVRELHDAILATEGGEIEATIAWTSVRRLDPERLQDAPHLQDLGGFSQSLIPPGDQQHGPPCLGVIQRVRKIPGFSGAKQPVSGCPRQRLHRYAIAA
jgi:hypothetical protein